MRMKKRKTMALALVAAMLLSVGNPVKAYAADAEYVVSERDLDAKGNLVLNGGTYTRIVIPEGLKVTGVNVTDLDLTKQTIKFIMQESDVTVIANFKRKQ